MTEYRTPAPKDWPTACQSIIRAIFLLVLRTFWSLRRAPFKNNILLWRVTPQTDPLLLVITLAGEITTAKARLWQWIQVRAPYWEYTEGRRWNIMGNGVSNYEYGSKIKTNTAYFISLPKAYHGGIRIQVIRPGLCYWDWHWVGLKYALSPPHTLDPEVKASYCHIKWTVYFIKF